MGMESGPDLTRRSFLQGGIALGASLAVGGEKAAAHESMNERRLFGGMHAIPVSEGPLAQKWKDALAHIDADLEKVKNAEKDPEARTPAYAKLRQILDRADRYTGRARLGHLNQGVNLSIVARDEKQDAWNSPLEALARGGDCEEYAMTKWLGLRRLGIPESAMKIVIFQPRSSPDKHAFLAVQHEDGWLILDNQRMSMVEDTIALREGLPLYALDRAGVSRFSTGTAVADAEGQ